MLCNHMSVFKTCSVFSFSSEIVFFYELKELIFPQYNYKTLGLGDQSFAASMTLNWVFIVYFFK